MSHVTLVDSTLRDGMHAVGHQFTPEQAAKYHPTVPHWHLTIIGVDPIRQGQGYGAALLKYGLAVCDRDQKSAYLVCTKPSNIDFYQRYGFELLGTIQIGEAPPIFPMIRKPRSE